MRGICAFGLLLVAAGGTAAPVVLAQGEVDAAQVVAAKYFDALTKAEVDTANKLVAVPFSLDRRKILRTREEVEAIHARIAEDKGARKLPPYDIEKTDKAPKLDPEVFGKYIAYRITIDGQIAVDIYVAPGKSPKVIGFSD